MGRDPTHTASSLIGVRRLILALLLVIPGLLWCRSAAAYPWTIQHGYRQCRACHLDPSGAGILTRYGRGTSEDVLVRFGDSPGGEATPASEFLWGAIDVPEPLLLGGDIRILRLSQKIRDVPLMSELIYMQMDLEAGIDTGRFVASASLGYVPEGALGAALTRGDTENLVSRQHWIGYRLDPDVFLLRAGRMNLPFGIRNIEHTLWNRALTRTDINDDQQYGVALALDADWLRGEVMAIAGNFQLRPDDFRERGYSAFLEWAMTDHLAVGASSLVTHSELDQRSLKATWRHAHGLMARWSTPYHPLVFLSEWNYVLESPKGERKRDGIVGHLQADWEIAQGVHFLWTGEVQNMGRNDTPLSYGAWLSYAWFFAPHADLRLDGIYQKLRSSLGDTEVLAFLAQAHLSL